MAPRPPGKLTAKVQIPAQDTRQHHAGCRDLSPTPAGARAAEIFSGFCSEGQTLDAGEILGSGRIAYHDHDHR